MEPERRHLFVHHVLWNFPSLKCQESSTKFSIPTRMGPRSMQGEHTLVFMNRITVPCVATAHERQEKNKRESRSVNAALVSGICRRQASPTGAAPIRLKEANFGAVRGFCGAGDKGQGIQLQPASKVTPIPELLCETAGKEYRQSGKKIIKNTCKAELIQRKKTGKAKRHSPNKKMHKKAHMHWCWVCACEHA